MLDARVVHSHREQAVVNGPMLLLRIAEEELRQLGPTYLRPRWRLAVPRVVAS